VSLDVCKGMGVKISEITHTSAERLGLPRNTTYNIFAKGNRLATCFRAKGGGSNMRLPEVSGMGSLPHGKDQTYC
jgi:hypothetical protein